MFNKLFNSSLITLILCLPVYANNPIVNIERFITDKTYLKNVTPPGAAVPFALHSGYYRKIGENKDSIVTEILNRNVGFFEPKEEVETINLDSYNILQIKTEFTSITPKALYILNNENKVIGYCILESLFLMSSSKSAITTLQTDNNLLNTVNVQNNTVLSSYKSENNNFIERYVILDTTNSEVVESNIKPDFLVAEAFYPSSLDDELIPIIRQYIQEYVNKFNVIQ